MTQQEWRDLADDLERFCDDFDTERNDLTRSTLAAEIPLEIAASLVDRARMLIAIIRQEFPGN